MKPTVRVSIGGLAFNLEEDAYAVLDNYLKALRQHFEGNPEADEIIADIESRLSELLQMRIKNSDSIVTIYDAQEIIKIMGSPKDFDDNTSYNGDGTAQPVNSNRNFTEDLFKKRLFRDVDNKIIGGVCSGLSHYFKVDATAIRLLFVGLFLLLFFFINRNPSSLSILVIYAVLWAVMPAARSFKQKLEMTGEDPSIVNIEDRTKNTPKKYKGSFVGSALGVFINIIVGLIAISCVIALILIVGALVWLHVDTEIVGLSNYMILLGYNTVTFKIAVFLVAVLPIMGLINLLFKIIRRSPFTSRTTVGLVVGLVIWFGALFYLGNKGMRYVDRHDVRVDVPMPITTDTLHVKLAEEYLDAIPQPNNPVMYYKGENERRRQVCILPIVHIREDSLLTDYRIEIRKSAFGQNRRSIKKNAESLDLDYSGSNLIVSPKWYSQNDPWNLEVFDMYIYVPRNKKVILEAPLSRSYNVNSVKIRINGHDYFSHYRNFDHH